MDLWTVRATTFRTGIIMCMRYMHLTLTWVIYPYYTWSSSPFFLQNGHSLSSLLEVKNLQSWSVMCSYSGGSGWQVGWKISGNEVARDSSIAVARPLVSCTEAISSLRGLSSHICQWQSVSLSVLANSFFQWLEKGYGFYMVTSCQPWHWKHLGGWVF